MFGPVTTPNAPGAIGPYSQAIRAGDFVFLSGQIPLDPATGPARPGGIGEQTHQVLKNLGAVLEAAGSSYASVVKTTVYLADMGEFSAMNEILRHVLLVARACPGHRAGRQTSARRARGNRRRRLPGQVTQLTTSNSQLTTRRSLVSCQL